MRIYTETNHTERNEREKGERGKKQSMSRGDAGIMPSISGRAISSPSFVSAAARQAVEISLRLVSLFPTCVAELSYL